MGMFKEIMVIIKLGAQLSEFCRFQELGVVSALHLAAAKGNIRLFDLLMETKQFNNIDVRDDK